MKLSQMRSFRDVVIRFRENRIGYVREFRLLLILVLLASLADMVSTIYFMQSRGPGAEGHPAVRMFSEAYGPVFGPVLGKAVQFLTLIGVTVFLRNWAKFIFIPIIILYTWAAWYNVWGYELYHPPLVQWLEQLAI
mgnify:CR=1 FL=1